MTTTAEIIDRYEAGATVGDIAAETGLTYQQAYNRLRRGGVLNVTPRTDTHPLTRIRRHRIGAHVGKPTDLPADVAERIMVDVAKHGGTLWDAVGRLLA